MQYKICRKIITVKAVRHTNYNLNRTNCLYKIRSEVLPELNMVWYGMVGGLESLL